LIQLELAESILLAGDRSAPTGGRFGVPRRDRDTQVRGGRQDRFGGVMPTTDHASNTAPSGRPATSGVIHLDALKRRKRLDRLEATRSHLATMAAQQRSHGLDEAQDKDPPSAR
jgi:hypothetical protein